MCRRGPRGEQRSKERSTRGQLASERDWEVAQAREDHMKTLVASDSRLQLDSSWILLLMYLCIIYSFIEHERYYNVGWKEVWIKTCDETKLLDSTS